MLSVLPHYMGYCKVWDQGLPKICQSGEAVRIVFDEQTPPQALDSLVAEAQRRGLNLQLAARTVPGYHPDAPVEPNLILNEQLQQKFCAFWVELAKRYEGCYPELRFVPMHRPYGYWGTLPDLGPAEYAVVIRRVIAAIRDVDAQRGIVVDGMDQGKHIPTDLFDFAKQNVALCGYLDDSDSTRLLLDMWAAYAQVTGQELLCLALLPDEPQRWSELIGELAQRGIGYITL